MVIFQGLFGSKKKFSFDNFFWIDEFGISVNSRLSHGWSLKGERVFKKVTKVKSTNFTCCVAMTTRGVFYYKLKKLAFDGAHYLSIFFFLIFFSYNIFSQNF